MSVPLALFLPEFEPNLPSLTDTPLRLSLAPAPPLRGGARKIEGLATPDFDAPDFDAPAFEASDFDAPDLDAPDLDASEFDAPDLDAPHLSLSEETLAEEDPTARAEAERQRIAQAREEALVEAGIATEAALAAQAADLESRHAETVAQTLAEERRRWVEQESSVLARQLREGLDAMETRLAESVADILKSLLDKGTRAQAAEELRQAVTQILATAEAPMIRIGGPGDLVEPLRSAFAAEAAIEIVASDDPEVTVEAGDTTIRTQLQSWADTLEGHLGEAN